MTTRGTVALAISFAASFLAVGLPYWRIPYAKASLPSTLYAFGLVVVLVCAAASRLLAGTRWLRTIAVVGAAVPGAVLARVAYETSSDPTSHNLWPLELIIASGVGLPVAFCGALVGGLLAASVPWLRFDRGRAPR